MKKYILVTAMAAGLLASCSNEEVMAPAGSGNVTFTAQLPSGINTRAYADGTTAKQLTYALYDEDKKHISTLDGTAEFENLATKINLNLVTGKTYTIALWADAPGNSNYTFDKDEATITVATSGNAQDENRDAFFANFTFTVNGTVSEKITLTRPFAQINVGTSDHSDFLASKETVSKSGMAVRGYNTLNLLNGKVGGEMVEYTFSDTDFPVESTTGAFPYKQEGVSYKYLSMNYILIGEDKETVDVKWTNDNSITERQNITFYSVPVQRNYRTNIFGALLTNPADYEVEIKPGYDGSIDLDQNEIVAEGVYLDEPTKTYSLTSKKGLDWLAEQMDGNTRAGGNTFSGYTVKLLSNVDLSGVKWTPLGNVTGTSFQGTFDGCGNTISNMTVDGDDISGFFRNAYHVKNLNFKNVTVTGHYKAGVVTGDGLCSRIENCHVDGGTITVTPRKTGNGNTTDDANNVGGITGYLSAEPEAYIKGCSVKNMTITAYRKIGGIAGAINGSAAQLENNIVENVKIVADMSDPNYDGAEKRTHQSGLIFGTNVSEATISDTNTTVNSSLIVIPLSGDVTVSDAVALEYIGDKLNADDKLGIKSVTLDSDIDATGVTTTAVWRSGRLKDFVFDGNGYTIRNLTLEDGFFPGGSHNGLSIKNVTFENCKVTKGVSPGVNGTAVVLSQIYGNFTLENVHVKDCSVEGNFAVGGLVGQYTNEGGQYTATLSNCSVTGTKITAAGNSNGGWIEAEGVAGANVFIGASICWYSAENTNTITLTECTQSGNTITNDSSVKGGGLYGYTLMNEGKTLNKTEITE